MDLKIIQFGGASYASPTSIIGTRITRPSDHRWFSFSFDAIPVAAAGGNEPRPQFFTDVGDMHIQQVGKRAVILIKQVFVKLRAGDDFSAMPGKKFHERIFAGGEFDEFFRAEYIARRGVDFHVVDFDDVRGLVRTPADERAETGK